MRLTAARRSRNPARCMRNMRHAAAILASFPFLISHGGLTLGSQKEHP